MLNDAYVCTYLIGLKYADVTGPLEAFQHTLATKEDTHQLVKTINAATSEEQRRLPDAHLDRAFGQWWTDLEKCLNSLPSPQEPQAPQRTDTDMLREVLEIVRDLAKSPPIPSVRTLGGLYRRTRDATDISNTPIARLGDLAYLAGRAGMSYEAAEERINEEDISRAVFAAFSTVLAEKEAPQASTTTPKPEAPNTSAG